MGLCTNRGVEEGLCNARPTAGALKSAFQEWEGEGPWALDWVGAIAPPAGLGLGGAPAWGPLWEPPQYRGSSSSKFKVELIQRGQPSHLETQKERELVLGEEGSVKEELALQASLPQALRPPKGAQSGTDGPQNPHYVGYQL